MYCPLTLWYDALFKTLIPKSIGFYQAPKHEKQHPERMLDVLINPLLFRSVMSRKFMLVYEHRIYIKRKHAYPYYFIKGFAGKTRMGSASSISSEILLMLLITNCGCGSCIVLMVDFSDARRSSRSEILVAAPATVR